MPVPRKHYTTHDVTKAEGVVTVMNNKWFWCEDGKPEKAVFYRKFSPQCNSNNEISERIGAPYEGCELVFIEQVFAPYDTSNDY